MVIIGGKSFTDKNRRGQNYECAYKRNGKCKVIAKRIKDEEYEVTGTHSVLCNRLYAKREIREMMRQRIQEAGILSAQTSNRQLFDNIKLKGVAQFKSMERNFRLMKEKVQVNIPLKSNPKTTTEDLCKQLKEAQEIKFSMSKTLPSKIPGDDDSSTLKIVPITSESKGVKYHHLIMYDPSFVEKFSIQPWAMDGTFDGRPNVKDCEQLFTVLVIEDCSKEKTMKDGSKKMEVIRKPLALFYALTSNRTIETYVAIFTHMHDKFPNLDPKSSQSDYELAPRRAMKIVFPDVKLQGCWFHENQASMKNAVERKVADKSNTRNPMAHKQLKKFQALALLPPELMVQGFNLVREEARRLYCTSHYDSAHQLIIDLNPLWEGYFNYHGTQWLNRETPESTSVYRCLERTNNFSEQRHRHYPDYLGKRQTIDVMIRGVLCLIALDWTELVDIQAGIAEAPRKSVEQRERDALIEKCWTELENSEKTSDDIKKFLQKVTYFPEEKNPSLMPLEAEKICITYGNYREEKFTFEHLEQFVSAKDIFEAPMICCPDLREAKLVVQFEKYLFPFPKNSVIFVTYCDDSELEQGFISTDRTQSIESNSQLLELHDI